MLIKYFYDTIYYEYLLEKMNIKLEMLFEEYHVWEHDRYEINQIFEFLPLEKKKNLLNNFGQLAKKLHTIHENIKIEQEILIVDVLSDVKFAIDEAKKKLN